MLLGDQLKAVAEAAAGKARQWTDVQKAKYDHSAAAAQSAHA